MVASSKVDPTLCNRYPNQEKEYIFCVKGRPFGCLVSPHLPIPTSSLIDYNLVKDLGLKMSDLQYSKFFFAGNKMRILGKVTMTVQTIHEGIASGNLPFKANVVLNLFKCLDIDAVAGVKLRKRLSGEESELDCTSSGAPSTCSGSHNLTKPLTYMGEYSSKKSLSCQTLDFVNPYLTNFVLEHYLRFLGYFENLELKDLGI